MPKMLETSYIWKNKEIIPWNEAKIHVMTHALHYGSAVFEGILCRMTNKGPAIFRLKDHVKRLFNSAKIYKMEIPYTEEEISQAIIELVKINKIPDVYIRPIVFRGYKELGVNPLNCPVEVVIGAIKYVEYLSGADEGIKVCISTWRRPPSTSFPSIAKDAGKYALGQLIKMEAIERGFVEAIALTVEGNISEGSGENIFVVSNQVLYTPPISDGILPGITRDSVIIIAKELGIEVKEMSIPRSFLETADEVFFTGTWAGITPIVAIENVKIGDGKIGPITKEIRAVYDEIRFARSKKHMEWLTFIQF
jgi:branched-chain amino acid aminotransferase